MTNADDLAYPTNIIDPDNRFKPSYHTGMSKREYFAAIAMQGIVSNHAMIDTLNWGWLSEKSVEAADALISELNKNL